MITLRLAHPRPLDLDYERLRKRDDLLLRVQARSGGPVQWVQLSRSGCGQLYVAGKPCGSWASSAAEAMRRYLASGGPAEGGS